MAVFEMETGRARLSLACQGAVGRADQLDAGTKWHFEQETVERGQTTWRFVADRTCWTQKQLAVVLTADEALFRLEVEGRGAIDRVTYFAGYPADLVAEPRATLNQLPWARRPWARAWSGSPRTFQKVSNPQPNAYEEQYLDAGVAQRITCATTFGPEVFNTFFAPPLYAYVFDQAICLGVVAPTEQSRFNHFDYVPAAGWGLELHYDGMTRVDGTWTSPAIRVAACDSAEKGLEAYAGHLRTCGCAPGTGAPTPDWAHQPIFCGWGQQTVWAHESEVGAATPSTGSPVTPGAGGYATQAAYELMVGLLEQHDIPYGTLTIDMGWSTCLTIPVPDADKWPDLKGFVERLHRQGKRVLLWLAAWNPGGLDAGLRMPHAPSLADCCDPSNPEFSRQLAEAVDRAVSPAGLGADGFKLDFSGDLPRGQGYSPAADTWGLSLLHRYVKLVHDAMKAAKDDTVLETHCASPHFADVTEMLRLNDIFCSREDVRPMMAFRARMARIALPGAAIDTDNDPFVSKAAWLDYLRFQPQLGVPSLYTLTHMSSAQQGLAPEALAASDMSEVSRIWHTYMSSLSSGYASPPA